MKLLHMLMFLFVIQVTISFYYQLYEEDVGDYLISSYNQNDTKIWEFVKDPTKWNASPLLIALLTLGTTATAFIVIGVFTSTPSDTAIFAPVFVLLIGAGLIPIVSLYTVITNNVQMFGCSAMPCAPALFLWSIVGGTLALMYVSSVLEWWSNRKMS